MDRRLDGGGDSVRPHVRSPPPFLSMSPRTSIHLCILVSRVNCPGSGILKVDPLIVRFCSGIGSTALEIGFRRDSLGYHRLQVGIAIGNRTHDRVRVCIRGSVRRWFERCPTRVSPRMSQCVHRGCVPGQSRRPASRPAGPPACWKWERGGLPARSSDKPRCSSMFRPDQGHRLGG